MARPNKQGVDYFPLDVHLDDKFKFIEIKYKLEGFAILIKLMQKIYSYGYWYKWTDDEALLFADEIRANYQLVVNVVNEALERGVFNKELHTKFDILTSKGIQKRFKEIVRRRKDVEVIPEYLLIDGNFGVNDDINKSDGQQNDGKSTQSKVKESKEDITTTAETNPFNFYEQNGFGTISPTIAGYINEWLDGNYFDEPKLILIKAMEEAVSNNVRKWNYVDKVLINWDQNKLRTLNHVDTFLIEHKNNTTKNAAGKRKDALSILKDL